MDLFLGITGLAKVGKGETIDIIANELESESGILVLRYSLSAEIDLGLRRRGIAPQRENMRHYANKTRLEHGKAALAVAVAADIFAQLRIVTQPDVLVIIDSIRVPDEVDYFRRLWGSHFKLLAIIAPDSVIEHNRQRKSDPKDMHQNGEFIENNVVEFLNPERGIGQPQHGTDVPACIKKADFILHNNEIDDSLALLRQKVKLLLEQSIIPIFRS